MSEITLSLSEQTISSCEKRITNTEFESIEEYIEYIVSETVQDDPRENLYSNKSINQDQLESLGYL